MKSAISIKDLKKTYPPKKKSSEKIALKGVSLEIPKGSIFGLLGPNGAGKSTLINILAGLTLKSAGEIVVEGISLDEDARGTRFKIGVVPQEVVLDPFFTVEESLEYYAGYFGIPKSARRTEELLKALSLWDKRNSNSRRLSGGMKRRVLIAKALVHNPDILILDEPTAGVDVELRSQLWEYVRKLNEGGMTVLLTTHYLEEAEELCDNIAIINHGEIVANDTKENLLNMIDWKKLTLKFNEEISSIPSSLTKYETTIIDNNTISITYKKSEVAIEDLLSFTKESNLSIKDLSTEEADLEDIFRELTA